MLKSKVKEAQRLEEPPIFSRLKTFVSRSNDEAQTLKKNIALFEEEITKHNTKRDEHFKIKRVVEA